MLAFKWDTWAKRCLLLELAAYLVWLGAFQAFTLLFQAGSPAHLQAAAGIDSLLCT